MLTIQKILIFRKFIDKTDIDGVLNSSKTIDRNFDYPELDPRNLKVLKDIVELSHAVLVLLSSWKL